MIDARDFRIGAGAYWKAINKNYIAGICVQKNDLPDYPKENSPAICVSAKSGGGIASVCRAFYNEIPQSDQPTTLICPFGIKIQCAKIQCGHREITASVINGQSNIGTPAIVGTLKRFDKERAQQAFKDNPARKMLPEIPAEQFNAIRNFGECLVYGGLALPIRGYAHELLTPIQGLINDLDGITHLKPDSARESLVSNAELISDLAKKIQVIISGQIAINGSIVRKAYLHTVVKKIIERFQEETHRRRIEFEVGYNGDIPYVDFTPDLFDLALSCLLENAVKYSFDGLPDRNNTIKITFHQEQDEKIIKIHNSGCYIHPDEIATGSIFELNKRGRFSGDRHRQGTGNGLYIVAQIIRAHGGEISASSNLIPSTNAEPFAHTLFTLRLKIHPTFPTTKTASTFLRSKVIQ